MNFVEQDPWKVSEAAARNVGVIAGCHVSRPNFCFISA
jgi:hypothetical protein